MRCSAWSSLAISACSALFLVPAAQGHVTVAPAFVPAGETATLTLTAPNEREQPMTGFAVSASDGLQIIQAVPDIAWPSTLRNGAAVWYGRLAPGDEATFTVRVEAWATPGPAKVLVTQRYPGGKTVEWPIALTVTPAPDEPTQQIDRALVAALVGLLVTVGVVGLAWRRRTRSLQEK